MATVNVSCLCGRRLTIDSALAGTSIPCPTCGCPLTVPSEVESPLSKAPWLKMTVATTAATAEAALPRRRRHLPAWLIISAAGVVAIVLALLVPKILLWRAENRLEEAQNEVGRLPRLIEQRVDELQRQVRGEKTLLSIAGPRSLQAGAGNSYTLTVTSLEGKAVPAKLSMRLTSKGGKELARSDKNADDGRLVFAIPLPATIKPGEELTLEATAEREGADAKPIALTERLPVDQPSYLTHLMTDKPLYRPGEVVAFRSLTLERFRLQPTNDDLQLSFTINDPSGKLIYRKDGADVVRDPGGNGRLLEGPDNRAVRGVGFGEFAIPKNAAGGEYQLTVSELRGRFAPEKRKFLVNRYQAPRLHKQLEFTRRSFGPGDEVVAACRVSRIEGGKPLADQKVKATVIVDGKRLDANGAEKPDATLELKTDAEGAVAVRFKLPKQIENGEASLSIAFTDGGNNETIVRPIPIVVRRLRVDFYPEGGDLIAGLPNRVYFAARTPLGKPAEMRGRILDGAGEVAAELQTFADEKAPEANQGMGSFTFIPKSGQSYQLQIDAPAGIPYKVDLPQVRAEGVVLAVESGLTNSAELIKAKVWSAGAKRRLLIAAYCRGGFVGSESAEVEADGFRNVAIMPSGGVGGVYRITVFEDRSTDSVSRLIPVAERLIFRRPAAYLNVSVQPDRTQYVPGDGVRLAVNAKDENGKRTGAIALVQVVDRSALSLADDKTIHSMPAHLLLTNEVRRPEDLENADFLLSDHPSSATAVDLLLGTQGWRRFSEQDPNKFRTDHESDAERLLTTAGQLPLQVTNRGAVEIETWPQLNQVRKKVEAEFHERSNDLSNRMAETQASINDSRRLVDQGETFALLGLLVFVLIVPLAGFILRTVSNAMPPQESVIYFVLSVLIIAIGVLVFLGYVLSLPKYPNRESSAKQMLSTTKDFVERGDFSKAKKQRATFAPANGTDDEARPGPNASSGGAGMGRRAKASMRPPDESDGGGRGGAEDTPRLLDRSGGGRGEVNESRPVAAPAQEDEAAPAANDPAYSSGTEKAPPSDSARRRYERVRREQSANRPAESTMPSERSFRDMDRSNRSLADPNGAEPFVIREYAHENFPGRSTRTDFTETVYWHPVLILPDGEAFVKFNVSDAVTSYQVLAVVHTPDGRLGSTHFDFSAKLPFSIDAKLPVELTANDELRVPVAVANDTDQRREVKLSIDASGMTRLDGEAEMKLDLDAAKRGRKTFRYKPSIPSGEARVRLDAHSGAFEDRVERTMQIVPDGFPVTGAMSGTLGQPLRANVILPAEVTPGSFKLRAEAYPSVLAELLTGLDGMLQEPHGCFEQTSSSSYPNLLILNYLQATGQSRPEIARRAMNLLEAGYLRLISFECQRQDGRREGFEWFGGSAPPHEALTAYGLMQFHDLSRVYDKVDPAMIERTRKFLLARRDGAGNFRHDNHAHSFGSVSQPVFNAYLTWALTESDTDADLTKETQLLVQQAETSADPYFLALVANSLLKRNDKAAGTKILDKVVTLQQPNGSLHGQESIVGSYDSDRDIEATALTILAWYKAEQPLQYRASLQKATQWLMTRRSYGGMFGSTQGTILALKALTENARESKRLTPGSVILSINGDRILQKEFASETDGALTLELSERDLARLKPGANEVRLEVTRDNEMPAKIAWSYRTIQPPSSDDCPIKLTTALDKDKANEGDTVRLTAVIQNTAKDACSMTTAVIGLPAGLSLPEDMKQIEELTKLRTPLAASETQGDAKLSYIEVHGRELILYWRGLDAGQRVEVSIDLIARVPGTFHGPASRAYRYYGADAKCWAAPLHIWIDER